MKVLAIIPSRFGSTRLPGKPLKLIGGKPMIQRVYEQVSSCSLVHETIVATDDERIKEAVLGFGGKVEMTSSNHKTGTDRCIEVLEKTNPSYDLVLNVQGDEPFVQHAQLVTVVNLLNKPDSQIASLKKAIKIKDELFNPNTVKVVVDDANKALYFSRNSIPFLRGEEKETWLEKSSYYKHIGIYGFKASALMQIKTLQEGVLEKAESLEQLRWLENGFNIYMGETDFQSPSVDTEEDLVSVENFLKKHPQFL